MHKICEMAIKKIMIIGLVWPEPTSSAAGTRMIQLVKLFLSQNYAVTFASAASKGEHSYPLSELGVNCCDIMLNDNSFNGFLQALSPQVVLFDRFMVEEQYGWRVMEECPDAIRILDTEDLHCLRQARQQAVKSDQVLTALNLNTDMAKREIASIYRSDLSLIISESEVELLKKQFQIDPKILHYLPFLETPLSQDSIARWKPFEAREGFTFIGNYLHEPNWHTLQVLKTRIWPLLRKKLPGVSMHIYGAYASQKVLQLQQPKEHFYVHGRVENAQEAISRHRVLLAPIQFGAGVKGKFIDAMHAGTPAITTVVGAEAMKGDLPWNGIIATHDEDFIAHAVSLYHDKPQWLAYQKNGIQILRERYHASHFTALFINTLNHLESNLALHRDQNFIGQMLQHHLLNSCKYMSLWIEEKNKNRN